MDTGPPSAEWLLVETIHRRAQWMRCADGVRRDLLGAWRQVEATAVESDDNAEERKDAGSRSPFEKPRPSGPR